MLHHIFEAISLCTWSYVIINGLLSFQSINGKLSANIWEENNTVIFAILLKHNGLIPCCCTIASSSLPPAPCSCTIASSSLPSCSLQLYSTYLCVHCFWKHRVIFGSHHVVCGNSSKVGSLQHAACSEAQKAFTAFEQGIETPQFIDQMQNIISVNPRLSTRATSWGYILQYGAWQVVRYEERAVYVHVSMQTRTMVAPSKTIIKQIKSLRRT